MGKIRFAFLALLTAGTTGLFAQERGHSFSPNHNGYYYLRTQFTGDDLSLESNGAASRDMNGAAFMSSQKGATGTMWQFVADHSQPGWYRLKSKSQGNNKCLEANGKDSPVHGGASFMDDCKNVSGQFWRLELVNSNNGNHLYRLRVMGNNNVSLEGNRPGLGQGGNAFMDNTQNVTGQMWRLIPVGGGGSNHNNQAPALKEVVYNKGWAFSSPNNRFTIKFQEDGNLVLYKDGNTPIWSTNTHGRNAGRLVFQVDGNLVMYDNNNRPIWSSNSHNKGGQTLELQNDGNFVIYTADRRAIWATNTSGR